MQPSSPYVPWSAIITTSAESTDGTCTAASIAESGSFSTASRLGASASSLPPGSVAPSAASTEVTSWPRFLSACAIPWPERSEISRSLERPPMSTATFIGPSSLMVGRSARPLLPARPRVCRPSAPRSCRARAFQARERTLAPQELRDQRQLGAVRAPRERGADRLVELAALDAQRRSDGLNSRFNRVRAPLRKRAQRGGGSGAHGRGARPAQRVPGVRLERRRLVQERTQLTGKLRERRQVPAERLEHALERRARPGGRGRRQGIRARVLDPAADRRAARVVEPVRVHPRKLRRIEY